MLELLPVALLFLAFLDGAGLLVVPVVVVVLLFRVGLLARDHEHFMPPNSLEDLLFLRVFVVILSRQAVILLQLLNVEGLVRFDQLLLLIHLLLRDRLFAGFPGRFLVKLRLVLLARDQYLQMRLFRLLIEVLYHHRENLLVNRALLHFHEFPQREKPRAKQHLTLRVPNINLNLLVEKVVDEVVKHALELFLIEIRRKSERADVVLRD